MRAAPIDDVLSVERLPSPRRSLRIAIAADGPLPVAEGASGFAAVVAALRERGHELQVVRPKRRGAPHDGALPLSRLLAKKALLRLWRERRPDVIVVDVPGRFGWSALQTAAKLRIPVATEFRLELRGGLQLLRRPILAYLRKFHNQAQATFVGSDAVQRELQGAGFRGLALLSGADAAGSVDVLERHLTVLADAYGAAREA